MAMSNSYVQLPEGIACMYSNFIFSITVRKKHLLEFVQVLECPISAGRMIAARTSIGWPADMEESGALRIEGPPYMWCWYVYIYIYLYI